jgi:hypothetical protein
LRAVLAFAAALTLAASARAQRIAATPAAPIVAAFPADAPPMEVQIALQVLVDSSGRVESAVVVGRAPSDAPDVFADAAVRAVKATAFTPSTVDGRAVRSRIEWIVAFQPPIVTTTRTPKKVTVAKRFTPEENTTEDVEIHGVGWPSSRGIGDVRVKRELLDAAPHQQTSEMLSAAPGFFVDHEDGEGIGNDVYLRGFDLDHGSGIEMRVGSIPINVPLHIQGQGYADANFIIPEVVRGIRVLAGTYDPRQGDAAIVGSAYFDLGVIERGTQLRTTYGSFDQARVLGIVAPRDVPEETFAAFAVRHTDGFGSNRAGTSASANAQYGVDLGPYDHLRLIATGYAARFALAGVVRQDDVDAGRIGFTDSYQNFGENQSVQSERVVLGADFDHETRGGGRFEFEPFFTWTDFRARQNFTGALETSQENPALSGLGDLFESTNTESAAGLTSRYHFAPTQLAKHVELVTEPGIFVRAGHTDQSKSLLVPSTLAPWDHRLAYGVDSIDAAGYVDFDLRLFEKLRISGGVRADYLGVSIHDELADSRRGAGDVVVGPRVSIEYRATKALAVAASYGEGFRSLAPSAIRDGGSPYSRVRSVEVGVRAEDAKKRYTSSLAVFDTFVDNELVFEAEAGGYETENASTRRGVVGTFVARPTSWLLASTSLSIVDAVFTTLVPGVSHYVPNVPPVLFRVDATVHHKLGAFRGSPVTGRVSLGYTFLAGKHLTDSITGPSTNALNAGAAVRYQFVEIGVEGYNLLGLQYPDDAEYYVSNWSVKPGQQLASNAIHLTAAPPTTVLGSLGLYF